MDHKHACFYDVLEGKPIMFTSVEDRIRIQLQFLTIFLKNGGQI